MATPTLPDRKLTFRDCCGLPEDLRRHEIVGGVHHVSPGPLVPHQSIVTRLIVELMLRIERPGLGRVLTSPIAVELGPHDIVQPDVLVVLAGRSDILARNRVAGAPDLVVEVLSRSTRRYDRVVKRDLYERARVAEYWLVDPVARAVEQLVLSGDRFERLGPWTDAVEPRIVTCAPIELRTIF